MKVKLIEKIRIFSLPIFKIVNIFLIICLVTPSCLSFESRSAVTGKNKAVTPLWVEDRSLLVRVEEDGALILVSVVTGASSVVEGASEAQYQAHGRFKNFFIENYYKPQKDNIASKKIEDSIMKVLLAKSMSSNYKICDLYYEKRGKSTAEPDEPNSNYDVFLCLKIENPANLIGDVNRMLDLEKSNPLIKPENSKIAH